MKDQEDHFSIPHHATNNLFLRFMANHIFSPISSFFLHLYQEILDRLGSDYDEEGIPYWEK